MMCHRKPDAWSVCSAAGRSRLETSGTIDVFGPFETVRLTTEPLPADVPADGLWSMTVFAGWLFETNCDCTLKPAAWSCELAWSRATPITYGTETGCGPFETLKCTSLPTVTFVPGFGSCASTRPAVWFDGTSSTFGFSPSFVSADAAAVEVEPTRFGTVAFGSPVETSTRTSLPFGWRVPASGDCR